MGIYGTEPQSCPCFKDFQVFQKLLDSKNTGLVVYCHSTNKNNDDEKELVDSNVNISQDAFILHNTSEVEIIPSDLTTELDKKDLDCPRCKKRFEHAQEVVRKVKSIDGKQVLGVCDHCRKKTYKKPCYACEDIVKKFLYVKGEQKEDTRKYIKIWLSKMGHFLKDATANKIKTRAYSDLQIHQLYQKSTTSRQEPEIEQMFYSKPHKSDINLYTKISDTGYKQDHKLEQTVNFIEPDELLLKPHPVSKEKTLIGGLSLVESDITFIETHGSEKELPKSTLKDSKQDDIEYYDDPLMDAKKAIKLRHDLSLRHIMRPEKDLEMSISKSKKPDIYEIPKIAPWEQKEPFSEYLKDYFEDDTIHKLDSKKRPKKVGSYYTDVELKEHSHIAKFRQKSEKSEQRSVSKHKETFGPKTTALNLKKQFSFFFPKTVRKEEQEIKVGARSSELIKNTQEKFRLQNEQKLEENRIKKLAREEKKRQAIEDKRQAIEKKYAEKQKKLMESEGTNERYLGTDRKSAEENKLYIEKTESEMSPESAIKRKISKESLLAEKGLKAKPEQRDKIDEVLEKIKKEFKSKSRIIDEIDAVEELTKVKKELKSKPEKKDELEGEFLKSQIESKPSSGKIDEMEGELIKHKKEFKSKPEKKNEIDGEIMKDIKRLKSKPDTKDELEGVSQKSKKSKQEKKDETEVVIKDKKEFKSKLEKKDVKEEELLKDKKELKSKVERKYEMEGELMKDKTELKSKPEKKYEMEVELMKNKKELKSKSDTKDELEGFSQKSKKSKQEKKDETEGVLIKDKKELKSKLEKKDIKEEELLKDKKELKSKVERKYEMEGELMKDKKELKSKSEKKNETKEELMKDKVLKSKTEHKDEKAGELMKYKKESKSKTEKKYETEGELMKDKKEVRPRSEKKDDMAGEVMKHKKELKSKPEDKYEMEREFMKDRKELRPGPDKKDEMVGELMKYKKKLKSKPEKLNEMEGVLEKTKQVLKVKPEKEDEIDRVLEKLKKELKPKPEQEGKYAKLSEKRQKDTERKLESKQKDDDVVKTGQKSPKVKVKTEGKDDEATETAKKHVKATLESKGKDGKTVKAKGDMTNEMDINNEVSVKPKKHLRSKSDQRDETGDVSQKSRADLKSKSESKYQSEKGVDKGKKTPDMKDLDKETTSIEKKIEKQERDERLQNEKEEKEKLKQIQQLHKEREAEKKKDKERDRQSKKQTDMVKESKGMKQMLKMDMEETSKKKQELTKVKEVTKSESKSKGAFKEESSKVDKDSKERAAKTAKEAADEAEFKKLQAAHLKEKEEALKMKKQHEIATQKAKDMVEKKLKEEAERKGTGIAAKPVTKTEPSRPTKVIPDKIKEEIKQIEVKMHDIKIDDDYSDDYILRLVRIKQAAKSMKPGDFDAALIKAHKCHLQDGRISITCALCIDSELEIDVESYDNKVNLRKDEITEIIIGEQIFKHRPRIEKSKESQNIPFLFKTKILKDLPLLEIKEIMPTTPEEMEPVKKPENILTTLLSIKDPNMVELEPTKGIVHYALSDRTFIDKGWTMLPTEKVVRKMNVYRMRPAHPEFDWFEHNKNKRLMTYDTGERLAEFDDNGRGRWYYRNGCLALDYYNAEEANAQQRFVLYSSGEPDERGRTHPITILATFDYLGNGIVFDHAGKIRLKYNQTEGVVLDRGIGPVSHWKWHTLNDPPVLQQVMIDTQMSHKDPEIIKLGPPSDLKTRPDNEEMLAIEFDNFIKEKSKKLSQKFKPFQIKMKALKINEHFSLRVLDQATIYLIFRDGSTNLKLNIGMVLDHQEIVDTDTAEVGEVSNSLERFPARTDSLAGLQRSVAYAQRYERQRTERDRRLRRPEPCASVDHLTAAASPPLRPPLRTMPVGSTSSTGYCSCRKPTKNNLYYNTRLI